MCKHNTLPVSLIQMFHYHYRIIRHHHYRRSHCYHVDSSSNTVHVTALHVCDSTVSFRILSLSCFLNICCYCQGDILYVFVSFFFLRLSSSFFSDASLWSSTLFSSSSFYFWTARRDLRIEGSGVGGVVDVGSGGSKN